MIGIDKQFVGGPRRAMRLLVVLAVGALALGGCKNNKKEQELTIAGLQEENNRLQAELETVTGERNSAVERATAAENELSAAREAATKTPPPEPATTTRGGDRILSIAGDVAFGPGQTSLTAAGRREVDKIISIIRSQYSGSRIEIAGFTDSDPLRKTKSKYTDNENLSAQRALAVERYMNQQGIPGDLTHSAGYGPSNPKGSKKDSRRVEIRILAN
ncbi:MAG: OmpA family protein [Planctomycetota bacterium]|nr:OmpA family protein [Planctomycetota bacterium]